MRGILSAIVSLSFLMSVFFGVCWFGTEPITIVIPEVLENITYKRSKTQQQHRKRNNTKTIAKKKKQKKLEKRLENN